MDEVDNLNLDTVEALIEEKEKRQYNSTQIKPEEHKSKEKPLNESYQKQDDSRNRSREDRRDRIKSKDRNRSNDRRRSDYTGRRDDHQSRKDDRTSRRDDHYSRRDDYHRRDEHYNRKDGSNRRQNSRERRRSYDREDRRNKDYNETRVRKRSNDRHQVAKMTEEERQIMLYDKQIEQAKIEALEAEREDNTVQVFQLHYKANEKAIFKFFTRHNIGKVVDIKMVRDSKNGKPKGIAFVEFESNHSVMLAVALSGQAIMGQHVIIAASQADKNRAAKTDKYNYELTRREYEESVNKAIEEEVLDKPMRVFIKGLTENFDNVKKEDVRTWFGLGEIEEITINLDPRTGDPIGNVYVTYARESIAKTVIRDFNGKQFKGIMLTVGEASDFENEFGGKEGRSHKDLASVQQQQILRNKLNRDTRTTFDVSTLPVTHTEAGVISECLLIHNIYDISKVDLKNEPDFFEDVEDDIVNECKGCGRVEKHYLDKNVPNGGVFIMFATKTHAQMALNKINGRYFDGLTIKCNFISRDDFLANIR